jgi:hypothetical protein
VGSDLTIDLTGGGPGDVGSKALKSLAPSETAN